MHITTKALTNKQLNIGSFNIKMSSRIIFYVLQYFLCNDIMSL
jgi:hypothetical protein